MSKLCLGFGVVGLLSPMLFSKQAPQTFFITGDYHGHLTPCGCTKPMSGGILRMATLLRKAPKAILLDVGGWRSAATKQDRMKAETLAEAFASLPNVIVNLTQNDLVEGESGFQSMATFLPDSWVGRSVSKSVSQFREIEGWRVYGIHTSRPNWKQEITALDALPSKSILILDGSRAEAKSIAQISAGFRTIIYRSAGDPTSVAERVNQSDLVSPGAKGKALLRLDVSQDGKQTLKILSLDESIPEDPEFKQLYSTYQQRIESSSLLALLPRVITAAFAGSERCGNCHAKALQTWQHSAHSGAYKTLQKVGNSQDPDCVSCHVVGLDSKVGFSTLKATPQLAGVGCESCHGPGAAHSRAPYRVHLKRSTKEDCMKCHNTEHSAKFNFVDYWAKIKHK